jgi:hypothetical protein
MDGRDFADAFVEGLGPQPAPTAPQGGGECQPSRAQQPDGWLKADMEGRRSERVMLTIPLLASGHDAEGRAFECDASTVSVNRYGARIRLSQMLLVGQTLRLINRVNKLASEFRVVGFVGEGENGVKEWGVENQNTELDYWGIYFPPISPTQHESTALLECSVCHTVGLLPLSLPEVETLEAGGSVSRFCYQCELDTEWLYREKAALDPPAVKPRETQPSGVAAPDSIEPSFPAAPSVSGGSPAAVAVSPAISVPVAETRKERRHYVRRPITICDSSGRLDLTRTENLSKNGVCLTSERDYASGQEVTLLWPHPVTEQSYQAQARVIRRHVLGGTARKIYGLEYLSAPVLVIPAPQSVQGLYWGLAGLVAAAAALMAAAVFRLAFSLAIPTATWRSTAELSAAALILFLAHQCWMAILRREAKNPQRSLRRQRAAKTAAGTVLAGAILGAGVAGFRSGQWNAQALRLVNDLSLSDAIEGAVDQTETLDFNTPQDYAAACARLKPLSRQWQKELEAVSGDAVALRRFAAPGGSPRRRISAVSTLVALDRQKLALLQSQTALSRDAALLPADQQLAFWQSRFAPLGRRIARLNEQQHRLLQSLAATK